MMTESNSTPSNEIGDRNRLVHEFSNHLSVIVGFCELLLTDLPEDDPRRADIVEIHRAAQAAIALLPRLSGRAQ